MAKVKILITGTSGMLGSTLVDSWQDKFEVYATDRSNFEYNPARNYYPFDLSSHHYDELLEWARPDVIIHCAAITDVDYCEEYPEQAMTVNGESVKMFLQSGIRQIFISSDAVFPDGIHLATETDKIGPQNIYGESKVLGEKYIRKAGNYNCAIRTTIVGKNINQSNRGFVEWIINSVKSGKEITLFDDVFFTPITIWNLAEELEWVIDNNISGIVHIAGRDPISKYDFGFSICEKLSLDTTLIKKVSINDFSFKAKRSKDQTMNVTFYEIFSNRCLPTGEDTINLIVKHFEDCKYD